MAALTTLVGSVGAFVADWRGLRFADLLFAERDTAALVALALTALALATIALGALRRRAPGRRRVALPAIVRTVPRSRLRGLRSAALLLFVLGLPFFLIALADPHTALAREDVTYPGRRISLMIDASSSMTAPFKAARLNTFGAGQEAFYTTVGAAERFVKLRMAGKYRDLMALIEFGNEAYVVTPFTNDYDNILLSLSLISDPYEFHTFPDQGTMIGLAINQSVQLFRAFDFLNAAGNLMVIFSDGEDSRAVVHGMTIDEIVKDAVDAKVPIYFIRTNYDKKFGGILPDELWRSAVERTGGRFYAASDENAIFEAIRAIDKAAEGDVVVRRYKNERPQFSPFATVAVGLWTLGAVLQLTVPWFRTFP